MESAPEYAFSGFTPQALTFLREVRAHNSREWFLAHRADYQTWLLAPFQALVADLIPTMVEIDSEFEIRPAVGKTLSRINRDTRFTHDKSLYRDAMWFAFKRRQPQWIDAPSYYFELSPTAYRYGMGYYAASRNTMDALRRCIDAKPRQFQQVIAFHGRDGRFELCGDSYKRPLSSPHPAAIQTWYQRKSFYLMRTCPIDAQLYTPALVPTLIQDFQTLAPLYRYLLALKEG